MTDSPTSPFEEFLRTSPDFKDKIRRRSPTQRKVLGYIACGAYREGNPGVYGYEIIRTTGIAAGTLYPILDRLVDAGAVYKVWEDNEGRDGARRAYYIPADVIPTDVIRDSAPKDCNLQLGI